MIWRFVGRLASKQVLPQDEVLYTMVLDHWRASELIGWGFKSARNSLSIVPVSWAIAHVQERPEAATGLLPDLLEADPNPDELAFVQYWHDPEGELEDGFFVTVGLTEERLATIKPDLDEAFIHGCKLKVAASGGFSAVDTNPYSKQPTREKFQSGLPLWLRDVQVNIEAPWTASQDHGEATDADTRGLKGRGE